MMTRVTVKHICFTRKEKILIKEWQHKADRMDDEEGQTIHSSQRMQLKAKSRRKRRAS